MTANGGKFSVLLGDTGQAALPADVWRSTQLHVRIAVKGGTTWVPLTGFQRVAPSAAAISAEEAASFTVRQDLSVAGNATVANNINVGSLNNRGAADIDGNLNVDGTTTFQQTVIMNNRSLQLRSAGDPNHRLVHGTSFGGLSVDGPQLIGFSGGILGTSSNNRGALQWDTGGVTINGNLALNGSLEPASYRRKGDDLFVVCERTTEGGRGARPQEIIFDNNSFCGDHTLPFGTEWVGALSSLDICGGDDDAQRHHHGAGAVGDVGGRNGHDLGDGARHLHGRCGDQRHHVVEQQPAAFARAHRQRPCPAASTELCEHGDGWAGAVRHHGRRARYTGARADRVELVDDGREHQRRAQPRR